MGRHAIQKSAATQEELNSLKAIRALQKNLKPCPCRRRKGLTYGWCGGYREPMCN